MPHEPIRFGRPDDHVIHAEPQAVETEEADPRRCGNIPVADARGRFTVKLSLVAIRFINATDIGLDGEDRPQDAWKRSDSNRQRQLVTGDTDLIAAVVRGR
ncbi:MAG: hypothetical protein ACE5I9_10330 [Candidatus Methylomirabilales bacterium]